MTPRPPRAVVTTAALATLTVVLASACSSASSNSSASSKPTTSSSASPSPSPSSASSTVPESSPPAPVVTPSGSPAPAKVVIAVTAAMDRWSEAATPTKECAAVSNGFGMFLGDGLYSGCPAHIVATMDGFLLHGISHVSRVVLDRGQAIATATVGSAPSKPRAYYFVQESGVWKLNSIGKRM